MTAILFVCLFIHVYVAHSLICQAPRSGSEPKCSSFVSSNSTQCQCQCRDAVLGGHGREIILMKEVVWPGTLYCSVGFQQPHGVGSLAG